MSVRTGQTLKRDDNRKQQMLAATLSIDAPTSHWNIKQEQVKLHMDMQLNVPWTDLLSPISRPEYQCAIDSMVEAFLASEDSQDMLVEKFWDMTTVMKSQLTAILSETEYDEKQFEQEFEDVIMADDSLKDIDISAVVTDRTRRVQFVALEDGQISSDAAVMPVKSQLPTSNRSLKPILSTGSDETLWSEAFERGMLDKLEIYTSSYKGRFLDPLIRVCEKALGIKLSSVHRKLSVINGKTEYRSSNNGRYVFHERNGRIGGAEVFCTEDKRRNASSTAAFKARLKIQVAGQMLATAVHRNVFAKVPGAMNEILQQQPQLVSWLHTNEETVLYLVFTHRSLNLVAATFDRAYLRHIQRGYLDDSDKVSFKWTKRYRLDNKDDLAEAIRMTMTMILNLGDEWKSGERFWRPFSVDGSWISA